MDEFVTKQGLHQRRVLSPTLVNLVMDDVMKKIKGNMKKYRMRGRKVEIVNIPKNDLQHNLDL